MEPQRPEDYGIELDKALDKNATYAYGENQAVLNYVPQFLNDNKTVQHKLLFDDISKYLTEKGYDNPPTFDPQDKNFNKGQYRPTAFKVGDGSKESRTFNYYRGVLNDQGDYLTNFAQLTGAHKKRIVDREAIGLASLQQYVESSLPENISEEDKEVVLQFQDAYLSSILVPTIEDAMTQYADIHSKHTSSDYFKQGMTRTVGAVSKFLGSAYEDLNPFRDDEEGKSLLNKVGDRLNEYANRPEWQGTGMFALNDEEVKAEHGSLATIPIIDTDIPTLREGYLFHKVAESVAQNPQSLLTMVGALRGGRPGQGGNRFIGTLKGAAKYGGLSGFALEAGHFQSEFEENYFSMREKAQMMKRALSPEEFQKQFGITIDEGDGNAITTTVDKLSDEEISKMSRWVAREYGLYSTAMEIGSSVAFGMGNVAFKTGVGQVSAKYLKSKAGQQAMAQEWYKKLWKKGRNEAGFLAANAVQEGLTERMQENMNIHLAENGGSLVNMEARIGDYGRLTDKQKRDRLSSATFGGMAMGVGMQAGYRTIESAQNLVNSPRSNFEQERVEEKEGYDAKVNEIKENIDKANENKKPFSNVLDQAVILRSIIDPKISNSYSRIIDTVNGYKSIEKIYPFGVDEEMIEANRGLRTLDGTLADKNKILQVLKNSSKTLINKLNISGEDLERLEYNNAEIKAIFPNYVSKRKPKAPKTNYTKDANIPTENKRKINMTGTVLENEIAKVANNLNSFADIRKKKGKLTTKQQEIEIGMKSYLKTLTDKQNNRQNVKSGNTKIENGKFVKPRSGEDPFNISRVDISSLSDHSLKKVMQGLPSDNKSDNLSYSFRVVGVSESVNPVTNKKEKVYNVTPTPDAQKLLGVKPTEVFQIHESSIRIALTDESKRYKMQEGAPPPIVKNPVAQTQGKPQPEGLRPTISNKKNTLSETLGFIEANSNENKPLAKMLKKSLKENINISFDGALKVSAKFSPSQKSVFLSPKMQDDSLLEQNVLHEAVHAVSSEKISDYQNGRLKKNSRVYKSISQLDKLFVTIKDGLSKEDNKSINELGKLVAEIKGKKVSKDEVTDFQKLLRDEFYGFTNLKEFTAELLTNKTFQEKLKGIEYRNTNKTLFDKFKDIIVQVFGVDKGDNALYNSLSLAMEAIDSPQQKTKAQLNAEKTFSSYDQPLEIGGLENTTEATYDDISKISDNISTVEDDFKKTKVKTMKTYMAAFGNRVLAYPKLIKSDDGDILILDNKNRAIAEIKSDPKIGGLRKERLTLLLPKQRPFSVNTVSVNNATNQVAKYNIPSLESIAFKEAFDKKLPKMKLTQLRDIGKERGIEGYAKMQKAPLIKAIKALPSTPTVEEVFNFGDKKETPIVSERQSTVDKKSYLPPKLLNVINDARDILKKYKKGKKLKSSDANYISGLLKDEYGNTKEYEDSKGRRSKKIIIDNFKHQSKEFRKFFPNIGKEPKDDGLGVSSGISVRDIEQAVKEYENRIKSAPEVSKSKLGVKKVKKVLGKSNSDIKKSVQGVLNKERGVRWKTGHKSVWFGKKDYSYVGADHKAKPMPLIIKALQKKVAETLGKPDDYYNSVLINTLPKGVGIKPHTDAESIFLDDKGEIGSVGILSFGGKTVIDIIDVKTRKIVERVEVGDGDVYEMPEGKFQNTYLHAVGPSKQNRISLTFRRVVEQKPESNVKKSALERLAQTEMGKEVITEEAITTAANNVVEELTSELGEPSTVDKNAEGKDEQSTMDMWGKLDDGSDDNIFEGLGFNRGRLQRNDQVRANNAFESIWLELQDRFEIDEMFWSHWRGMMQEKLKGTIYNSHFKEWADSYQTGLSKGAKDMLGVNQKQELHLFNPQDLKNDEFFSSHNINRLIDAGNWVNETVKQGLSINENKLESSTNASNSGKIENGFFRLIDLIPSTKQNLAIGDAIKQSKDFQDWVNTISSNEFVRENGFFLAGNKRVNEFLEYDPQGIVRQKMLRFYLSGLDVNRTTTNRGRKTKGIRTLFGLFTSNYLKDKNPEYKIRFMNHRNKVINRYNTPNKMRTRAIERTNQFEDGELMYLSIKDLYRWTMNENPDSKYKFKTVKQENWRMTPNMVQTLTRSLIQNGMVPLMIRGDSDLVPVAKITEEATIRSYAPDKYWVNEIADYTAEEQTEFSSWLEDYYPNTFSDDYLQEHTGYTGKAGMNRIYAQAITRHEAYKKMYGDKYWKYMTGHKMFMRSKLVFSQGTVNPNMPKQTAVVYDPKIDLGKDSKSKIVHYKKDGSEQEVPLVVFAGGQWRYKLDGKLLASESVHRETYPKYLGTNPKASRAKTSFYQRGETGALAFKHQEMTFHSRADVEKSEIYDGDGTLVATIKRDSRGYNQIYKEGSNAGEISYLGTPDENKFATGEYANEETRQTNFNEIVILEPESINLIMYPRDNDKSYGKMMIQLMNYHSDKEAQNAVMEMFDKQDPKMKFTPTALLNKFKTMMGSHKEMSDYMKKWVTAEVDNLPVAFSQNASLGAGFHPTQAGMNKNVIKNSIVEGIKDFNTYGSTLDVNLDVYGNIKDDETIIPYDHKLANNVFAIYRARFGGKGPVDIDDINNWIKTLDKPIELLMIRSPVPKKFGYAIVKVKELQPIGDTIVASDKVIYGNLEADGDGDKVTVVMAHSSNKKMVQILKKRHQASPSLALPKEDKNLNIANLDQLHMLVSSMIKGQGAIGQIASIARTTGILKTWFKSITITKEGEEPVTLEMRDLDNETIIDYAQDNANGVKGTVADHYYRYLQAAFDHGQFLLLDEWNYNRNSLYEMAFKYQNESGQAKSFPFGSTKESEAMKALDTGKWGDGLINPEHLEIIKEALLMPTAQVGQLLNGFFNGKRMSFPQEVEMSRNYLYWVKNRKNYKDTIYLQSYKDEGEGTRFDIEIKGSDKMNSIHEKMATKFSTFVDENSINLDIFDVGPEVSRDVNIKTMREMIDVSIESGQYLALADEGLNAEQFENLSQDEKQSLMRKVNQNILKAHKDANDFKNDITKNTDVTRNRNNQDLEDSEESIFDINKWSFDPVMRNTYEKWMEKTINYTPSQRHHFTLKFLFDTANPTKGYRQRDVRLIPPATRLGPSLLDPDLMEEYYRVYNEILETYDETVKKDNGWMEPLMDLVGYEWKRNGCIG